MFGGKMEISQYNFGVFYLCKALALAPFAVRKQNNGRYAYKRSLIIVIYSICLTFVFVFLTYRAIYCAETSKIPLRASYRTKSSTSKVVTILDLILVDVTVIAGVFCSIFGLNATRELNLRLSNADEIFQYFCTHKRRHVICFIALSVVPLMAITILLGDYYKFAATIVCRNNLWINILALDIWTWTWFQFPNSTRIDKTNTKVNRELDLLWYIPFYSLYYMLTALHVLIATTVFGIYKRYNCLNFMLRYLFLTKSKSHLRPDKKFKMKINKLKPLLAQQKFRNFYTNRQTNDLEDIQKVLLIQILAEIHASLYKCVFLFTNSYGLTILLILMACFFHLVATAYYCILDFLYLDFLWILFHIIRLLSLVEPCHLTTRESNKSIEIITEIQQLEHESDVNVQLNLFWQQLFAKRLEFQVCGLCKVGTNIFTSFSTSIATYLIILIQFQQTDDPKSIKILNVNDTLE